MSRLLIYPYKLGSRSATSLADTFDTLKIKPDGRYRYRRGDTIINWGSSTVPNWWSPEAEANTLNKPQAVALAANKLRTLNRLEEAGIATLEYTDNPEVAQEWDKVFCRTVLNGHSGEGIEIWNKPAEQNDKAERYLAFAHELEEAGLDVAAGQIVDIARIITVQQAGEELPEAPLYTKAVANHGEYRVHVFRGRVIDYRKKSRRVEDPATPEQSDVRTLGNGWIFRADNLRRLERIENLALAAINALGLDFGAVDIIMDEEGDVRVVEVNTAVSMEEQTLENYSVAINEYYAAR